MCIRDSHEYDVSRRNEWKVSPLFLFNLHLISNRSDSNCVANEWSWIQFPLGPYLCRNWQVWQIAWNWLNQLPCLKLWQIDDIAFKKQMDSGPWGLSKETNNLLDFTKKSFFLWHCFCLITLPIPQCIAKMRYRLFEEWNRIFAKIFTLRLFPQPLIWLYFTYNLILSILQISNSCGRSW